MKRLDEELHENGKTKEENPEIQTNTNQRFQEAAMKLQAKVFFKFVAFLVWVDLISFIVFLVWVFGFDQLRCWWPPREIESVRLKFHGSRAFHTRFSTTKSTTLHSRC